MAHPVPTRPLWRLARALALGLLAAAAALAQGAFERARPSVRTYGMEDGLPSGTVYSFARDAKGRLWAGTVDGAAYFAGRGWVRVPMPRASASQYLRDILAASDGSLWFATQDSGVWRLHEGVWTHFEAGADLPSNRTFSLAETRDEAGRAVRWVGTADHGIAALVDGRWRRWGPAEGLPGGTVWRIREVHEPSGARRVWAATEAGLFYFAKDRWHPLGIQDGFLDGEANDILSVPEADGRRSMWVSLWKRGLARWDGHTWQRFPSGAAFPARFPTSSLQTTRDRDGQPILWVGTLNQGLWFLRKGHWHALGRAQGVPSTGIMTAFPDPGGKPTLWIGTRGGGVSSLDLGGWRTLDEALGLPDMEVNCFAEEPGGAFWVGTASGLVRYGPDSRPARVEPRQLPSGYVISVLPTDRAVWVATLKGLARRDATGWHAEEAGGLLKDRMTLALLETRGTGSGRVLWVGTPQGLARLEDGRWRLLTRKDGLPHDYVSSLCPVDGGDGTSTLWVGTRGGGVARWVDGTWQAFGTAAGLPNSTVYALHATRGPDGRAWLWAGTLGGGLARLDAQRPTRWEVFNQDSLPDLTSNYVQRIEEDRLGRLYLSTSAGICRVRLAWRDGVPWPERVETITLGDGLPSLNGNLGASYVDREGRVWMGTSKGAAVLDPEQETFPAAPPAPVLERATADVPGRAFKPGERLGHRDNHLRFEFSLPVTHRKEDTLYQTQLVGLEPEPRPWRPEGWREFATLPSGSYTLRVWARSYDGRISGPVEFPFQVAPAPWLHPLALFFYAAALLGLGLAILRVRTQVLQARTRALQTAVKDRTRIIEEQAAALEASNLELLDRNRDLATTVRDNERLIGELSRALAEVKTLRGLIPICAYCKKIRGDEGFWEQLESYLLQHSDARFSHGICPECRDTHFGHVGPHRAPQEKAP